MQSWQLLGDVLILLLGSFALAALFTRWRQSAILGYLLAGTLLGPNALGLIASREEVALLAELGVALLLFSIGLEFSWRRLLASGKTALLGGVLQIAASIVCGALAGLALGLATPAAFILGAALALSSTASVLRLLQDRAELDSLHGRLALGILLIQDLSLIPLVLLTHSLVAGGDVGESLWGITRALGLVIGLVIAFQLAARYLLQRLLGLHPSRVGRELPLLLALVIALGSAWLAHEMGISPSIGAFLAGMMLAESPYAAQIRADVSALRTLFLTLFFSSVGMLADPLWVLQHIHFVAAAAFAIMGLKCVLIWGLLRALGALSRTALATGLSLAQAGEFAFVLLGIARGSLLAAWPLQLLISATLVTLFATPLLVMAAGWVARRRNSRADVAGRPGESPEREESGRPGHPGQPRLLLIGYGPAGRTVSRTIEPAQALIDVLDLNPGVLRPVEEDGHRAHIGDALQAEMMEHLEVAAADVVVVTIPDPHAASEVIRQVRALAPCVAVLARARYHRYCDLLLSAGAHQVVDEEGEVGQRLAAAAQALIAASPGEARAPDDTGDCPPTD